VNKHLDRDPLAPLSKDCRRHGHEHNEETKQGESEPCGGTLTLRFFIVVEIVS
jgi:hypothetical protein